MSEDGKTDESLAGEACRLLSREELIVGHKEDGRAVYRREAKATLVAAATAPQASVARIAREHGLNANQLHAWIRQSRRGETQGGLAAKVSAGMERAAMARRNNGRHIANAGEAGKAPAKRTRVATLLPVTLITETVGAPSGASASQAVPTHTGLTIEIGAARIILDGAVDPAMLNTVITCLRFTVQDTVGDTVHHTVSHTITTAR